MTFTELPDSDPDGLEDTPVGAVPRRWWVIGGLGCALMLAVVAWFAVSATTGRVSWQTRSYEVVDATSVRVEFTVHRPSDRAVTCRLKAMNERFGTVGSMDLDIPSGPQTTLIREGTIRTTAAAVTGLVDRCELR